MNAVPSPSLSRTAIMILGLALFGPRPASFAAEFKPAPQEFRQEVPLQWAVPPGGSDAGFTLVDLPPGGGVRVSDGNRWYALKAGRLELLPPPSGLAANAGYIVVGETARELPVPLSTIRQVHRRDGVIWFATPKGVLRLGASGPATHELADQDVRQIAAADDLVLAATARGLWRRDAAGAWAQIRATDDVGRVWTYNEMRGVAIDGQGNWWLASPAGVFHRQGDRWSFYTAYEGLPYADFTGVAVGEGSDVWFGTRRGAIRFDGKDWAYREGAHWLPGNEVRSLLIGADGHAWFATDKGLGCIERRSMTLAAKAAHYEEEVERYIKRTPFGYLSEVDMESPGDRSKIIYSDSDNDGLWTAMYGAGECFAYGATKQSEFKKRAQQAFEALRFLQKVTQGGPHSPPKGYVARTIRPVEWPDPNVGRLESDRRTQARDKLWKAYEPRWPRSADGKWYWKSDTSSDELDGHYFFNAAYYDLVADTEAERERVREVVRDLTDHLVAHDFNLTDLDGKPTRWAVFSPRSLKHDPNWIVERGLNSLSMLSYLAVTEHITGDPKYGRIAQDLINNHSYGANIMHPKVQMGVGSGNQSDDEMAFMCFYNLLRYTKEEKWRARWRYAFYSYWALEQPELNPFFDFAFAAVGRGQVSSSPFGRISLEPWEGWIEDSMATLRGFPLDRANWGHQNSHRLDLIPVRRQQASDLGSAGRFRRGYRVNGKVLPVENRHFNHWNTDPWQLDYGGNGRGLASGTVFLLPYYMGMYHGFIEKPR